MQKSGLKMAVLLAAFTVVFVIAPRAAAQRYVTLVDWTSTWRYNESGMELGTAWRTNTYDDSGTPWLSGMGLLGNETGAAYPAPFNTVLNLGPANNVTTNFYFRIHFTYYASNFVAPLTLWSSNVVDDGCVIYLNGMEAGRLRVPANQNAATYASGGPATEGIIEVLQIATNLLRIGDNVLAAEVHQVSATSSDVAWGTKFIAVVPAALVITNQPTSSQTINQGTSPALSVGVSGGPINSYQWQTNNGAGVYVNIPGQTTATVTHIPTALGTLLYRVIVSGPVNSVTSSVATVSVVVDTAGPMILSAVVESTLTNILLTFNEPVLANTVHSPINASVLINDTFRILMLNSNVTVGLNRSFLVAPTNREVRLTVNSTNWFYGTNYYILINRVRDSRTNTIAPNSIVPLTWPSTTNVLNPEATSQTWHYHVSWYFERHPDFMNPTGPDIYTSAWTSVTYTGHLEQATYWGSTVNPRMSFELSATSLCYSNAPREGIGFQINPSLFRTTFMWPTDASVSTNVDLIFDYGADDAAAVFLNGTFLFSDTNFPAGPITDATRATAPTEGACKVRVVPSVALRRGSNVLAVAVAQFNQEGDSGFVCKLDARTYRTGPLPPTLATNLFATNLLKRTNIVKQASTTQIFWPSNCYGCALVSRTNVNSGPWIQERDMANPFVITNPPSGQHRFYRLQRLQTNGFPNLP